jgi:tetratricopeptide (TPR) repeat protein
MFDSRGGGRQLVCAIAAIGLFASGVARGGAADEDGEAAFKAGRFADAAVAYARALGEQPGNVQAELGLANVALLRDRLDDAQRRIDAVLKADPQNAAALRVQAAIAARRGAAGTYAFTPPTAALTIPFVVTDPLPLVRVRLNGHDAIFFIDTGAPDIMIDPGLANELHLTTKAAGNGVFAGGKQAELHTTVVPKFELGGLRIDNVPATVLATRNIPFWPGHVADGTIGAGLLLRFLSTIDYKNDALVLRARSESSAFESDAEARGDTIVPMWLASDHFIFVRGRIGDGPEGMYNVDTGLAGGGLSATKATLDAAHVKLDAQHATVGQGGGGAVAVVPFTASATIGDLTVPAVPGMYMPEGNPYGIFPFDVAGTISHGFFRAFALTFDFDAMRLVVSK